MIEKIKDMIQLHRATLKYFEANGLEATAAAAQLIIDSITNGGCVYVCGNGGSAADAQHIAAEIVGRFLKERRALPAVALTVDTSIITAVANDYDFDYVYARQVEALVKAGDVLWALSTSGSSANIIKAVEAARAKGAKIIGFTGKEDSQLQQLADVCVCAKADASFPAQEIHQLAYHAICNLVEDALG
ncbi:MAG: SIS domain-containing protein [Phycisphaerae bacterium]|nr:SIS domain-containing protein [Phycisphaerae bacterium]